MAVVADGRVVLARGFGHADVEARRAADADTPYDVASVAKPLSAVVALRLVERGRLDLDRPMATYAGFPEFCAAVLEERGIFFGDYACEQRAGRPALTLRHVLTMTMNGASPGGRFLYNPPAYSWASRPMAEVAGVPFSALAEELVFGPAGMANSARIHRRLEDWPALIGRAAEAAGPTGVAGAGAGVHNYYTLTGGVLVAGERQVAPQLTGPRARSLYGLATRVGVHVCYCSVFDRCWRLENPSVGARVPHERIAQVPGCPRPTAPVV